MHARGSAGCVAHQSVNKVVIPREGFVSETVASAVRTQPSGKLHQQPQIIQLHVERGWLCQASGFQLKS